MHLDAPLAWTVALGLTLVPVALGLALGQLARRLPLAPRRALVLILLGASVGAPLLMFTRLTPFNPFDAWWSGGLFALTFGVRAWAALRKPVPRGAYLFVLGTVVVLCAAAELLVRQGSHLMRPIHPPPEQPLTMNPRDAEFGCRALFPDAATSGWFTNLREPGQVPRKPGHKRVMHVGDSVLEAGDRELSRSDGYAALLQAASPGEEHLNLGISNTGTDAHLLVLQRWLPLLRPDAVVLHAYPGNDIGEIDRPFLCSAAGPLFDYRRPGPPTAWFERASWAFSLERALELWPPPYPLRILASQSDLARKVVWTLARLFESRHDYYTASEESWRRYERLMLAFRDSVQAARVPLRVVVLPDPERTEQIVTQPRGPNGRRMLEVLSRLGIEVLDAALILEATTHTPGAEPLLLPNTPHFSRSGHRLVANWLQTALDLWREAARATEADTSAPRPGGSSP